MSTLMTLLKDKWTSSVARATPEPLSNALAMEFLSPPLKKTDSGPGVHCPGAPGSLPSDPGIPGERAGLGCCLSDPTDSRPWPPSPQPPRGAAPHSIPLASEYLGSVRTHTHVTALSLPLPDLDHCPPEPTLQTSSNSQQIGRAHV